MSHLLRGLGNLLKFFGKNAKFLPSSFAGLYIVINFIIDLFRGDIVTAFVRLSQTIFATEYVINKNVHLAIINSPEYGFHEFIEIIISLFILYTLIRFIIKLYVHFGGAQAKWAVAVLIVFFTIFPLEMAMVKIIDGSWGFIPLKDGVFFLIVNFEPVIMNIFGSTTPIIIEGVNNTTIT